MKKVVRYQCEWCGKEFKTPDRHLCKWRPEIHNCLSCRHRGMFLKGEQPHPVHWDSMSPDWTEGKADRFACHAQAGTEFIEADGNWGWNLFPAAVRACHETEDGKPKWCHDWEPIPKYKGKKSYSEIESARRIADKPKCAEASPASAPQGKKKVVCVKCGQPVPISKAEDWDVSGSTRRFICPSCAAEEIF